MPKQPLIKYTYAIGRRRSATAAVKLYPNKGESMVNGLAVDKYFPGKLNLAGYQKPFVATNTDGQYHFEVKLSGGGKGGQLDALILAISRALDKTDHAVHHTILRTAGLLTVDSRVRERRKVGTGGKARRAKQSPKR